MTGLLSPLLQAEGLVSGCRACWELASFWATSHRDLPSRARGPPGRPSLRSGPPTSGAPTVGFKKKKVKIKLTAIKSCFFFCLFVCFKTNRVLLHHKGWSGTYYSPLSASKKLNCFLGSQGSTVCYTAQVKHGFNPPTKHKTNTVAYTFNLKLGR